MLVPANHPPRDDHGRVHKGEAGGGGKRRGGGKDPHIAVTAHTARKKIRTTYELPDAPRHPPQGHAVQHHHMQYDMVQEPSVATAVLKSRVTYIRQERRPPVSVVNEEHRRSVQEHRRYGGRDRKLSGPTIYIRT